MINTNFMTSSPQKCLCLPPIEKSHYYIVRNFTSFSIKIIMRWLRHQDAISSNTCEPATLAHLMRIVGLTAAAFCFDLCMVGRVVGWFWCGPSTFNELNWSWIKYHECPINYVLPITRLTWTKMIFSWWRQIDELKTNNFDEMHVIRQHQWLLR